MGFKTRLGVSGIILFSGLAAYYGISSYQAYQNDFIPNYKVQVERELAAAKKLNSLLSDSSARYVNNNFYDAVAIYTNSVSINWLFNGPAKMREYGQHALNSARNARQSAANSVNSAMKTELSNMKPSDKSLKDVLKFMGFGHPTTATGYLKLDLPVEKVQPKKLGNQNKGNQQTKVARFGLI